MKLSFLLAVLLLCVCCTTNALRLGPYIKHHERVHLGITGLHDQVKKTRARRTIEQQKLRINFDAYGREFDLKLVRTEAPFGKNFEIRVITDDGIEKVNIDFHRFYRGKVLDADLQHSYVRATLYDEGLDATVEINDETYLIEPASRYEKYPKSDHVIYRMADVHSNVTNTHKTCGMDKHTDGEDHLHKLWNEQYNHVHNRDHIHDDINDSENDSHDHDHGLEPLEREANERRRRAVVGYDPEKKSCEMHLVSDHRFYNGDLGQGSATQTASTIITFLEEINRIYKFSVFAPVSPVESYIGINFAIRYLTIWKTSTSVIDGLTNPYATSTSSSSTFLNQAGEDNMDDVCLAHAFTAQDFSGGVLGLAWRPDPRLSQTSTGICSKRSGGRNYNTGITTTINYGNQAPQLQVILVFAHEVGHNFGMPHDTDCPEWCANNAGQCEDYTGCTNCALSTGINGNYIMWPLSVDGSQSNNKFFSDCSLEEAGIQIQRVGGCFTDIGSGPICGNGIIQGNEECDCGSTTDSVVCAEADICCTTDCKVDTGSGFECSDLAGDCCSSCMMTGYDSIDDINEASSLHMCRSAVDCYKAGYCVKHTDFMGKCPDKDYPSHNLTTPDGCDIYNTSVPCEKFLPEDGPYFFHAPLDSFCNDGANTCQNDGCTGSVCSKFNHSLQGVEYEPEECVLDGTAQDCHLACKFMNSSDECQSTYSVSGTGLGTTLGVTNINRASGKTCNSFQGYCSEGECIGVSQDTPLDIFLNLNVLNWVGDNWYIVYLSAFGFVLFMFLLRFTYRRKEVIVESARQNTRRFTMRGRKKTKPNQIKMRLSVRDAKDVVKNKERQSKIKEGFHRISTLFPTADTEVLNTVMRCSPHEEAAVYRLLQLGYGLNSNVTTLIKGEYEAAPIHLKEKEAAKKAEKNKIIQKKKEIVAQRMERFKKEIEADPNVPSEPIDSSRRPSNSAPYQRGSRLPSHVVDDSGMLAPVPQRQGKKSSGVLVDRMVNPFEESERRRLSSVGGRLSPGQQQQQQRRSSGAMPTSPRLQPNSAQHGRPSQQQQQQQPRRPSGQPHMAVPQQQQRRESGQGRQLTPAQRAALEAKRKKKAGR